MPIEQAQRLLGHVKTDTTMTYAMLSQTNVKNSHRKHIDYEAIHMNDWTKYQLGEVCSRLSSGKNLRSEFIHDSGDFPVYGGNGLRGYTDKANFQGECAIIGRQGAFCGNVRYFSGAAYMTEHAVVVCGNEYSDTKYIAYLLSTMDLGRLSGQSAQPGLSVKTLAQQVIELPPLPEQVEIGRTLRAFDDKIELNSEINSHLEQMAQAILMDTLGSVLYPPSGYAAAPIGNWLRLINGFAFKSSAYLDAGKYKVITIKNVQDGLVDSTGASYLDELPVGFNRSCLLDFGDVLLSLTGNVGRVGIVTEGNLLLNQRVAKFAPMEHELLPFWYFLFRQSEIKDHLINIAKGTAQQNLSPVETLKTEIFFDESAVTTYAKTVAPIFFKIAENRKESAHLAELRDTLLPRLMSGELFVPDLDPK